MYYPTEEDLFFVQMEKWMKNNPLEKPTDTWHKVVAWNKGKKLTESHKQAISDTHKKLPKKYHGNARPGIVFTEEHKRKLSESAKKRKLPMSEEAKAKRRQIALSTIPVYDTCPHCGWHGLKRVAYRYHFSKCKKLNKIA